MLRVRGVRYRLVGSLRRRLTKLGQIHCSGPVVAGDVIRYVRHEHIVVRLLLARWMVLEDHILCLVMRLRLLHCSSLLVLVWNSLCELAHVTDYDLLAIADKLAGGLV